MMQKTLPNLKTRHSGHKYLPDKQLTGDKHAARPHVPESFASRGISQIKFCRQTAVAFLPLPKFAAARQPLGARFRQSLLPLLQFWANFADKKLMGEQSFFSIVLAVLKNPHVIATAILAVFVIKFAGYIMHYQKKPPAPKTVRPKPVAPPPPPKNNEEDEDEADE